MDTRIVRLTNELCDLIMRPRYAHKKVHDTGRIKLCYQVEDHTCIRIISLYVLNMRLS
jgi:hypothetical protein